MVTNSLPLNTCVVVYRQGISYLKITADTSEWREVLLHRLKIKINILKNLNDQCIKIT